MPIFKKLNACNIAEMLTKCINFAAENEHIVSDVLYLGTINKSLTALNY